MIPRFKPKIGWSEFFTLFKRSNRAVGEFEREFAKAFGAKEAIAFPYGRSAQWAFFKALNISNAEIVMPAYTCSVVAHAITLSGNTPRFVDISFDDFNMDLDQLESKINEKTRAIIATHTFGYPQDVQRIEEIVKAAEAKYDTQIKIMQDCCHAFGAISNGMLIGTAGDVAVYAFNISKTMTSIFGGMLTFQDEKLAQTVRQWRDANFYPPRTIKSLKRRLYLIAVYIAFSKLCYRVTWWLMHKSRLLHKYTEAYHRDERIHFPPDYRESMTNVEAAVGKVQLKKYQSIVNERCRRAKFYSNSLKKTGWILPPIREGATYSHYTVLIQNREEIIRKYALNGTELGEVIQYSVPDLDCYSHIADDCPNSRQVAKLAVNFPVS